MNQCANHQSRHGLSQVEVVVSSLIVAVVLVGALNVLGGATRTNRVAADRLDAPGLAHQLMGEILALPYEDPEEPGGNIGQESGESGGSRAGYDDVDDYHGWNMDPPAYKDGTSVPGAVGWERVVLVQYFDPSTGSTGSTDTGVKLITVQVSAPSGDQLQLDTLRSQWGSLQQSPAVDTTVVTSIDAELQIGGTAEQALSSTYLKNHAYDQ